MLGSSCFGVLIVESGTMFFILQNNLRALPMKPEEVYRNSGCFDRLKLLGFILLLMMYLKRM